MALEDGSRLGPYEILGSLGAGGMGEVYRARDTRLDRTVAIKVLPQHMSASPEIKQRFAREAKVISSLSHPHICTLHDVGQHEGIDFLVMEHLEGETLAQRVSQGPLPMEQVLELGSQIADALDKAHKSGVIHRDLKPGNIMLTAGGVKLLDFGLARHQVSESQVKSESFSRALTETPSSAPLTVEGTILGTFQYMPPEQIEGQEADARSDIFAFGAVLYEMATGRKAFEGRTQASLIGSIMHSQPEPVSKLVPLGPPAFDRVVETCLAKDPEDRFGTAHDVGLQLKWIAEGGSQVGLPAPVAARRKNRERLAWGLAAAAAIASVAFAVLWVRRAPETPQVIRFQVPAPDGLPVVGSPRLSPDGRYVAFQARNEAGQAGIWLRPLNGLDAQLVAGTEDARSRPFWSPDSRHIGFFAGDKLKRVPVSGGPSQVICDAPTGADGSWSDKGVILYDGQPADPLYRVPAGGGIPVAQIPASEGQPGWPQFLPGGERFLYVTVGSEPELRVGSLDGGEATVVLTGQSRVEYAPPGHLLYVRDNTLVAQAFDPDTGRLSGDPIPLAQDLGVDNVGLAHFSASHNGVLAFRSGEAGGGRLVWVDRRGEKAEALGDPADIGDFDLSPDGRWLALTMAQGSSAADDIWVRDLVRGVTSRFTFNDDGDRSPVWSPQGDRIAYGTQKDGDWDIAVKAVGGTGEAETLLKAEGRQQPSSWSPDGRHLLYYHVDPETSWDIYVLDLEGEPNPRPFVRSPFIEIRARFSPDGRWVAYQSNESGHSEIYVQAFPGPGGKWQISTAGGIEPMWSPNGHELFYLSPERRMMRVEVQTGGNFEAGIPEAMFTASLRPITINSRYILSRDGERFLLLSSLVEDSTPPTTVVVNWTAELDQQ
ncbi:MAG: protein kinase [Acidobacteria bacterium]|nr:protein kinase [Acidobacteriota bacterium]